jgi:hypothetical protein
VGFCKGSPEPAVAEFWVCYQYLPGIHFSTQAIGAV